MKKSILLTTVSTLVYVPYLTVDGSDFMCDKTQPVKQTQCSNHVGQTIIPSNTYCVNSSIPPRVSPEFLHPAPQYNTRRGLPQNLTMGACVSEETAGSVPSSQSLHLSLPVSTGLQALISEPGVSGEISDTELSVDDRSVDQLLTLLSTSTPFDFTNLADQTSENHRIMCLKNLERFWEGFLNDVKRYKLTAAIEAIQQYLQQANPSYASAADVFNTFIQNAGIYFLLTHNSEIDFSDSDRALLASLKTYLPYGDQLMDETNNIISKIEKLRRNLEYSQESNSKTDAMCVHLSKYYSNFWTKWTELYNPELAKNVLMEKDSSTGQWAITYADELAKKFALPDVPLSGITLEDFNIFMNNSLVQKVICNCLEEDGAYTIIGGTKYTDQDIAETLSQYRLKVNDIAQKKVRELDCYDIRSINDGPMNIANLRKARTALALLMRNGEKSNGEVTIGGQTFTLPFIIKTDSGTIRVARMPRSKDCVGAAQTGGDDMSGLTFGRGLNYKDIKKEGEKGNKALYDNMSLFERARFDIGGLLLLLSNDIAQSIPAFSSGKNMMKVLSQCIKDKEPYEKFYKLKEHKTGDSAAKRLVKILKDYINDKHVEARIEGVEPNQVHEWLKKEISNDRQTIIEENDSEVSSVADIDMFGDEASIAQDIVSEIMKSIENSLSQKTPHNRDKNYQEVQEFIKEKITNIKTYEQFLEYINSYHAGRENKSVLNDLLQKTLVNKQVFVDKIVNAMTKASGLASNYSSLLDNMDNAIIKFELRYESDGSEGERIFPQKRDNEYLSNINDSEQKRRFKARKLDNEDWEAE